MAIEAMELADLLRDHAASGRRYFEFIRKRSLSVGLYILAAGDLDPQQPHTEDEVYYVIQGTGVIRVGIQDRTVTAGTTVFVPARIEHRFHSITQELQVLVFFAPAEHSQVEH